ncbi:hypothetical protein GFB49_04215 [Epibacterium sp. SM1979]|uniref:DUF4157 domain-containing protein n=1 Tax=Tritonibacter litoralis TaxID=2662264 RepID=A0A843YEC0_9RHOB|nr:hypothetical protein [Tritonibacter litoralis]MQQ07652.1 hypothetical protein [Tritonibacter litoralis]
MWRAALLFLLILATCGRPLTVEERAFLGEIHGDAINLDRVRFVQGAPVLPIKVYRQTRPRVACRERILPPVEPGVVRARPAAVALFNRVFLTKNWYEPNYMPRFPDRLYLVEAMLVAHEATHIWQWQNRAVTGYHPLRAASEHGGATDPYLFDLTQSSNFLDYGFEQQGAIVEEYVCCRALAPQGARTRRIHDMLAAVMPVAPLPKSTQQEVVLPWRDAELSGICA